MNTQPPFVVMAPEHYTPEELMHFRVNRDIEFNEINHALIGCYHNVLLFGERGTGKTFLVQLLKNEFEQNAPEVLPVIFSASHLHHYGSQDEVSAFSRAVILQICAGIWRSVLGKKYSELRLSLEDIPSKISFKAAEQKILQRIYACVMTRGQEAKYQSFQSVGFSAGAKGEKNETHSIHRRQSDILPFELFEFADELLSSVLEPHGKKRILILCDEGNHLPFFTQHQLLQRYIEVFRSRKIQFLFVAGYLNWDDIPELPECFETRINLKGFVDFDIFSEFINKHAGETVQVDVEATKMLWEAFEGHPRHSLDVCYRCHSVYSEADTRFVINSQNITQIISEKKQLLVEDRRRVEEDREIANNLLHRSAKNRAR